MKVTQVEDKQVKITPVYASDWRGHTKCFLSSDKRASHRIRKARKNRHNIFI